MIVNLTSYHSRLIFRNLVTSSLWFHSRESSADKNDEDRFCYEVAFQATIYQHRELRALRGAKARRREAVQNDSILLFELKIDMATTTIQL